MDQIESVRKNGPAFETALEAASQKLKQLMRTSTLEAVAAAAESEAPLEALSGRRPTESLAPAEIESYAALEAIILERMRPPYLILRDEIQIDGDYDRVDLIRVNKAELEARARSVGRVDLIHHRTLSFAGTGWLVDRDIAVTNRHVANVFAEPNRLGGYEFVRGAFGERMEARLDFLREHQQAGLSERRARVSEILYIAGPGEPDIAFLRVRPDVDVEPLDLFTGRLEADTPIAAIGYPAWDGGRNDPELMQELFKGIYDVKRFAPGMATGHESDGVVLLGDYTSLGGNSGSAVIALETGKVVGLHFAGAFRETNYAVAAEIVAAARARLKTMVPVELPPVEESPTSPADEFAGRDGYDPEFLGAGELRVPLPNLGTWATDVAPVSDSPDDILNYGHFSVVQSKSRRLPLLTAVNIDGERSFRLRRQGSWRLDGRVALEHQIGNELYRSNPLDRGHMVRRRDPGWGDSRDEAQQAEIDTFHYTNAVPQHEDLNQGDWVGLEDYILESAKTKDFKVSVFTGPVFDDSDRTLRAQSGAEDIKIPEEFWKVAVMVNSETGALSATGYVLTHGRMIRDLVEAAFMLGKYETYQVKIAKIEQVTGLDFGDLKAADPMGAELREESTFQEVVRRIEGPTDLLL